MMIEMRNKIRKRISLKALWPLVICLGITSSGMAQQGGTPAKEGDPMQEYFYPPELVMRYQNDIQLKPDQKETILSSQKKIQPCAVGPAKCNDPFSGFAFTACN